MSTYGYKCEDCGNEFDIEIPISKYEIDRKQACPKCGSPECKRSITFVNFALLGSGWAKDGYN
jgi:putative FmdB family regulatory protein